MRVNQKENSQQHNLEERRTISQSLQLKHKMSFDDNSKLLMPIVFDLSLSQSSSHEFGITETFHKYEPRIDRRWRRGRMN